MIKEEIENIFLFKLKKNSLIIEYETMSARLELEKLEMVGEVVQDTWENFAKNRTSALEILRGKEFIDYASANIRLLDFFIK
jgi:hypothetical protein